MAAMDENAPFRHTTVLLNEAVDGVLARPDGIYVDGTFGRGGHSRLLLSKLAPAGRLIGIDRDPEAIAAAAAIADARFSIVHSGFADMAEALAGLGEPSGGGGFPVPAPPSGQGLGQAGDDFFVVLVAEQGQGHREVDHDVGREFAVRAFGLFSVLGDGLIDHLSWQRGGQQTDRDLIEESAGGRGESHDRQLTGPVPGPLPHLR